MFFLARDQPFLFTKTNRGAVMHHRRQRKNLRKASSRPYPIKFFARAAMRWAWSIQAVRPWTDAMYMHNSERLKVGRRTKRYCVWTGRVRAVTWLNMSKYTVKAMTRAGLIKDLKKA